MALVNFWKGLAANYNQATHENGIYQCIDTGDTYIFGSLNKNGGSQEGSTQLLPPTSVSGNYHIFSAQDDFQLPDFQSITNNTEYWATDGDLYNTINQYLDYDLYTSIVISGTTYYLPTEATYNSQESKIYLKINVDYDNITRPQNNYVQLQIECWHSSVSNRTALILNWIEGTPSSGVEEPSDNILVTDGDGTKALMDNGVYKNIILEVAELPDNPDDNVLYVIPE